MSKPLTKPSVNVLMPRLTCETERQTLLQMFAEEVVNLLFTSKMSKTQRKITIKLTKTTLSRQCLGQVQDNGALIHVDYNLYSDEMFETIAHELIHAEQWASGKMEAWHASTPSSTPYRDRPWEVDAFARETSVAKEALKALIAKQGGNKFLYSSMAWSSYMRDSMMNLLRKKV